MMGSNVGRMIYGYCNGFFGDSYRDKRIEAEGIDWIVARGLGENDEAEFAYFSSGWREAKQKYIDEWAVEKRWWEDDED